ncbi:hypothetical protein CSQ96_28645 [Janthinobacterium sp. BJB412]|nr:hypothetical protein CSQ96_28645 [Janthinobacterium sp. BJB412]
MNTIKALCLAVTLSTAPLGANALAGDPPPDPHHPQASATKAAPAPAPQPPAKVDAQMKTMREMHEKMTSAKTPKERAALMGEHMKAMRDGMATMEAMTGGAPRAEPPPQDMRQQMEMMKMMMQMMMDRMDAAPPPAAK